MRSTIVRHAAELQFNNRQPPPSVGTNPNSFIDVGPDSGGRRPSHSADPPTRLHSKRGSMPSFSHTKVGAVASRAATIVLIAGGVFASTVASGDELEYTSQSKQPRSISQVLRGVGLSDLAPCRPAAAKHCSRSGDISASSLLTCAAILAAISDQIGNRCQQVLRRYGQL